MHGRDTGGIGRRTARRLPAMAAGLLLLCCGAAAEAADLSGCWSGHWRSCSSGHQGPLHADFCKLNETQYQAHFQGRFFKLLPFQYQVTLDVVSDDGQTVVLAGSSYLGRLFGTFHYRAEATECRFTARYHSCRDQGLFVLQRTACCCR